MSSMDDLHIAKNNLMEALGDKSQQYMKQMKLWFQMKCTKEEFDIEARKLMDSNQAHLHNQFLIQLFTKCSFLAGTPQSPPLSSTGGHHRNKATNNKRSRQHNGGFQPADIHDYVQARRPPKPQDEPPKYCTQELFLPDHDFIYLRLMLAAWEVGLKGAEQKAADLLVVAVQQFLKNVITTILSRRNGFCLRENKFKYALGTPVPNPWLRNSANFINTHTQNSGLLDVSENSESLLVPAKRPSLSQLQEEIAHSYASSNVDNCSSPITPSSCFEALQIDRNVIPSHSVYCNNMERILALVHHPSWEEIGE